MSSDETRRKRGYQIMDETDAIKRIEEVEEELAEIVRQHIDDSRTEKIHDLRCKLTEARADLVEARLEEAMDDGE